MKKVICVLCAGLILALTGCGSDNSTGNKNAKNVKDVFSSSSNSSNDTSGESSSSAEPSSSDETKAESSSSKDSKSKYDKIDTDLSAMSDTMAYAQAVNMSETPEKFKDKIVKVKGYFAVSNDNGNTYFACMLTDANACCSQPMEFVLADTSRKYPADYPELDSEITVVGVFGTYNEGTETYCRLSQAQII